MADLVVTSVAVDDAATQLKSIVDELENMKELWDDGDIWGHKTVKNAMGDFVESWWVKREKLQENLKDLQEKMETAAETWNDTEIELEKSLTPQEG
jgi:flagellar biosynthesis chaperone FliJ